ncbi:MAG TPA: hypothetical protein VKR22_14450, partial [Acidimicrobiales bacterium]|nr:hypothetical protein [Acidimicrobiales bacterium]
MESASLTAEVGSVPPTLAQVSHTGTTLAPSSGRRRLGVRSLLVLLILVPFVSAAGLLGLSANGAWGARRNASATADDAARLATVASARAQMNTIEFPVAAVSYAAQLGISEPVLDQLLRPSVPFATQMTHIAAEVASTQTFHSTPALRSDSAELMSIVHSVSSKSLTYPLVMAFFIRMGADIDAVWYQDYNRLQADTAKWQTPASFEEHAAALRQVYAAFLAGGQEVSGAIYVLEGIGPPNARQLLVQAAGMFDQAVLEFQGHLGPLATKAWDHLHNYPPDARFAATMTQGITVALNDQPPPFALNLAFAGSSMAPSIAYVADMNA